MKRDLSPREKDVANLFVKDYSHRKIAQELGISEKTVGTILCGVYLKLGLTGMPKQRQLLKEKFTQLP